jgi:hypothetical protein
MTNTGIPIDKYTVQAMADGLLNMGDIGGASSIVQVSLLRIFYFLLCTITSNKYDVSYHNDI